MHEAVYTHIAQLMQLAAPKTSNSQHTLPPQRVHPRPFLLCLDWNCFSASYLCFSCLDACHRLKALYSWPLRACGFSLAGLVEIQGARSMFPQLFIS